jgi:hypothetical protein
MAIFGAWQKWHPPVIRQSQSTTEGKRHENLIRQPERRELFCPVEADADDIRGEKKRITKRLNALSKAGSRRMYSREALQR